MDEGQGKTQDTLGRLCPLAGLGTPGVPPEELEEVAGEREVRESLLRLLFGSSCYFFSVESKSWDKAREFCRTTEADLVVINSNDEKVLVSLVCVCFRLLFSQEGTWKWVDGSPLTLTLFWEKDQPDNGGGRVSYGEEDCVQIRNTPGFWNDVSCETSLRWICEKGATLFV
uniref:C-type lectin domain-containing protein n=1 Tax=Oryzias latipes TaxID=8090 RepID=A0A3P9IAX4_ORYLA